MDQHPNEKIVRRFYEAFSTGDGKTLTDLMAEDIVWSNPGNSQISGDRKGLEEVFALFALCGELTGGNLRVDLETVEVDGDGIVRTKHRVVGQRGDRKLDIHETETVTIEDGKITRVEEDYSDQAASDAFWA